MDLILANGEELVGEVKIRSSFGCSDQEVAELNIPREGNKTKSSSATHGLTHKEEIMPHQPDSLQL